MVGRYRVRIVPAAMRIDRTAFSRLREQAADIGSYRCPHCQAGAEFRAADFERRFGSGSTALDPVWQLRFTDKRPLRENEREGFLDFACRGCGAPVRIIYRAGCGWAMGCLDWETAEVLEAEAWPVIAPDL